MPALLILTVLCGSTNLDPVQFLLLTIAFLGTVGGRK